MPMQKTAYLYRPVVTQAFMVAKKFKNLWFFGVFTILASVGGEYEMITRWLLNSGQEGLVNALFVSFREGWLEGSAAAGNAGFFEIIGDLLINNFPALAISVFVLLLILVITAVAVWFVVACLIALIKSLPLALKNRKIKILEALDGANHLFFPVLGSLAVFKIFLFLLFALLSWELWLLTGLGTISKFLMALSFIVFVLIALFASFILKYQLLFIIVKKKKFIESYKLAWDLFLANWLISIEMAFIMFGAYLVASVIVTFLFTIFTGIPIMVVPFYLSGLPMYVNVAVSVLSLVVGFISIILVSAFITVFQWAGWVALFEKLVGGDELSKLERLPEELRKLPEYFSQKQ
jgi:hypothetical protein